MTPTDTHYQTIKADETPEQTAERMLSSGEMFSPEAYREVIRGLLARPKPPEPTHEVPEYLQPKPSLWRVFWLSISWRLIGNSKPVEPIHPTVQLLRRSLAAQRAHPRDLQGFLKELDRAIAAAPHEAFGLRKGYIPPKKNPEPPKK